MTKAGKARSGHAGIVAVSLALAAIASSCGGRKTPGDAITSVPGTGAVVTGQSLLVSPDERWVAFFYQVAFIHKGLASVELATGRYVQHDLAGVPEDFIPRSLLPEPFNLLQLGAGGTMGWHKGRLYLALGSSGGALVFENALPSATAGHIPKEQLRISDGVAFDDLRRELQRRAGRSYSSAFGGHYSAAWRGDRLDETLYWYDRSSDHVYCSDPGQPLRDIAQVRSGFLKEASVEELRVSPDERYLAYTKGLELKLQIPTPYMRTVVVVLDLRGGREIELGRYRLASSLTWSADSRRLYFIGGGDTDTMAVRIADVARVVGE